MKHKSVRFILILLVLASFFLLPAESIALAAAPAASGELTLIEAVALSLKG